MGTTEGFLLGVLVAITIGPLILHIVEGGIGQLGGAIGVPATGAAGHGYEDW